jgi:hypothetical protein
MSQLAKCDTCKGRGYVDVIATGPRLFAQLYGVPLAVPFTEARELLASYTGDDMGAKTMLVRSLAGNLDTVPCEPCGSTGVAFRLTFGEPRRCA